MVSWKDQANDPKPPNVAEQRQAARAEVRKCRLALKEAQDIENRARLYVADCNAALTKATLHLEIVDPRARLPNLKVPLPKPGTQAHTILISCDKPTRAMDLVQLTGWNLGHVNVLLSNAFASDHMTKPERGYYLTRFQILVALGVADNLDREDDDIL